MKLHKYYSIDECNNEETLFQKLETLQSEGKIEFERVDRLTIKISDLDLTTSEEKKLVEFFESLDLYHEIVDEDDEDDEYYTEYDEFDDDYKPKKNRKSYDDELDEF
jgi:hypothetical protein